MESQVKITEPIEHNQNPSPNYKLSEERLRYETKLVFQCLCADVDFKAK